jgi:hypothetical protein
LASGIRILHHTAAQYVTDEMVVMLALGMTQENDIFNDAA